MVSFDLLKKAFSLYMRMCIHKAADSKEGGVDKKEGAWLVDEVAGVLKWCREVLLPMFNEKLQ